MFDHVRKLFAQTPEAKVRGYLPGRFSFNVKGGRCEACAGDGTIKIEMHFLPDVYVPCEVCKGARYNRDTLDITLQGQEHRRRARSAVRGGARVLRQPAGHRPPHADPRRRRPRLRPAGPARAHAVGRRGPAGQAGQSELAKRSTGHTIYILDEPTTGLHFEDIRKLLTVLSRLVDQGNTVLVIEHNLDVIKTADWIIDLGPEGGDGGGEVVVEGTPELVAKTPGSYTGQFLAPLLAARKPARPENRQPSGGSADVLGVNRSAPGLGMMLRSASLADRSGRARAEQDHARFIAQPPYVFHGSSRFAWALAYIVLLVLAAYGARPARPAPQRPPGARSCALAASVGRGGGHLGRAAGRSGDALLPRFVVFGSAILLVPWYLLCAARRR